MRKKRLVNVLTSAALTAALVMSMGMTAMADTGVTNGSGSGDVSVAIKKIVATDGKTYQPNTNFEYEISLGDGGTYTVTDANGDTQSLSVNEGLVGGLSLAESNFADYTYDNDTDGVTLDATGSYEKSSTITVNASVFAGATPGIYHYTVIEKSSANTTGYEDYSGVTYDDTTYDVYVYVLNNGGTSNYIGYVVVAKESVSGDSVTYTKSDLTFTNDYGADSTDDGSTHDLTIEKALAGTLQDATDPFTVTVAVKTGASGNGQYYQIILVDGEGNTVTGTDVADYVVDGGNAVSLTIKKGYKITINGLTEDAVVTVTETNTSGYTASYDVTSADGMTQDESDSTILSGSITKDEAKATLTNTKDATTPTGIILNFAPYILLVAFAGVFAVLFLGKKREEI
ncbi:MAG: hypothetical protein LIO92_11820 [Clostridiales bacterium]|nr:hypothetical protein [Clostridiales bacterium]